MTDKKVLTIQDISCVGQCSLTVALPIISACGVETCILPSAVLSTHTGGFKGYTVRDLTDDIPGIVNHWVSEGLTFDAIYTGYLGSIKQIDMIKDMFGSLLAEGGVKIVDPAMADMGKLYYGFDMTFVEEMKKHCGRGDIILPNITEAALLTGLEYRINKHDKEYIDSLLHGLSLLGTKYIVLKGIDMDDGKLGVAIHDVSKSETKYYYTKKIPKSSHGTGDCYASAFTGAIMQGREIYDAACIAADFVVSCIEKTIDDEKHWYGVKFEKALPMLSNELNR